MWGVARLFQEVAGFHVDTAGLGFTHLIEQGKAWVLCRTYYQVHRLPHEGDTVTIYTWSRGEDGLFAFREFEMVDERGRVEVASTAYWAIIDCEARHVVRLHDLMTTFEHHPEFATDRQNLNRLRLPRGLEPGAPLADFPVKPSMLDHTNHVNNAEYIKWIFDNLPSEADSAAPFRLSVEYMLETPPDDHIRLYRFDRQGSLLFQISNSRNIAVLGELTK